MVLHHYQSGSGKDLILEYVKSWNESREEYKLIGEMISLRKAEKITPGSKQQVISRIEKGTWLLL